MELKEYREKQQELYSFALNMLTIMDDRTLVKASLAMLRYELGRKHPQGLGDDEKIEAFLTLYGEKQSELGIGEFDIE